MVILPILCVCKKSESNGISAIFSSMKTQITNLNVGPNGLTTLYLQTSETFSIFSFWNSVMSRNGFIVWLITHEIKKGYVFLHETDCIDFSFKFFQRCLKDKSCSNIEFRLFCSVSFKLMKRFYTSTWEFHLSLSRLFYPTSFYLVSN